MQNGCTHQVTAAVASMLEPAAKKARFGDAGQAAEPAVLVDVPPPAQGWCTASARCRVEPTVSAQVLSAASDASRRRLRTAQVLAFSFALHDRLGAATAVCELVDKGEVDTLRIVSSIVHSRQGHEALCSALARRHPWYEVAVRGLISEGVPHR